MTPSVVARSLTLLTILVLKTLALFVSEQKMLGRETLLDTFRLTKHFLGVRSREKLVSDFKMSNNTVLFDGGGECQGSIKPELGVLEQILW
jgi:hypothetical protein